MYLPDSIFCVDLERYSPDLVLIDFAVNDYGPPKLMDALLRKVLSMPSKPVVAIVDLWVRTLCGPPRYLLHSFYYQVQYEYSILILLVMYCPYSIIVCVCGPAALLLRIRRTLMHTLFRYV